MLWLTAILLAIALFNLATNRRRWNWALLGLAALWLAAFAACGSSGQGYTNNTGTPAGTYTITVTGAAGSVSHTTTFTLTVQ